jgi:hypothetical protein
MDEMSHKLHGIWRLVSFEEQRPDGSWGPALGEGNHGYISYWPGGVMQVVIAAGDRPRLSGPWADIDPSLKGECLDKLVAYGGRYRVEGDRVIHQVDTCWIPNWEGRELVRAMSFPRPGQLLLATVPDPAGRARAAQVVRWERVA